MTDAGVAWEPARGAPAAADAADAADAPDDAEGPRRDVVSTVWNVILGLDLTLLASVFVAAAAFALLTHGGSFTLTKADLWFEVGTSFLLIGLIPFLWAIFTRVGGLRGGLAYLRMHRRAPMGLLEGLGWSLVLLVAVVAIAAGYTALWGEPPTSPVAEALTEVLDWPLVFAVALAAGIGEEILFRGVLQRWIGVWGQGILFGLAHAGYDAPLNVIIPLAVGIGFGYLHRWRRNLWVVIGAHFAYDFILLAAALLNPEAVP